MKRIILDVEPYSESHLMQALEFTAEDLSLNQVGQLSKRQRQSLEKNRQLGTQASIGCMALSAPFFLIGLLIIRDTSGFTRVGLAGAAILLPIGFMSLCVWTLMGLAADLKSNRVYSITGPISRSTTTAKNSTSYHLSIWGRTFTVSEKVYQAFAGGWVYTLYFGSRSNYLLSAEFISDEKISQAPQDYLGWALHINEKDLASNADGDLSESQRRTFEATTQGYWMNLVALALLLGLLLTVGFSVWWPEMSLRLGVLVLLCGLGVLAYFVTSTMKANQHAHVASVHGRVERTESALAINGERLFRVGALASAFVSGQTYTIYYVPLKTFLFDHYDPIVAAIHHPDDTQQEATL